MAISTSSHIHTCTVAVNKVIISLSFCLYSDEPIHYVAKINREILPYKGDKCVDQSREVYSVSTERAKKCLGNDSLSLLLCWPALMAEILLLLTLCYVHVLYV